MNIPMKAFFQKSGEKKISTKIKVIAVLVLLIIIVTATVIIRYNKDEKARNWIDKNILRKEILQDNVSYIELENENAQACVYSQYVGVLNNNKFDIYNSMGGKEQTLDIDVSEPLFSTNDRFVVVAQKGGQQVYLLSNKDEQWKKKIEGNISQIQVSKNGYVAIVIANTSHKTVIEMYNPEGDELFKTFLSTTTVTDVTISEDNKYLAIAEIDTSGTMIQSAVKVISIEKSQQDPENSIESTYKSEPNKLITTLKYQDKNNLLCMYTDSTTIIADGKEEVLVNNEEKKVMFSSVDLTNNSVILEEKSSGLFTADSVLRITNTESRAEKEYTIDEIAKNIYTKENVIAVNLGTEIEFINTGGWLIKKYIANQEITNVMVSNQIAGILYRNKIEIVRL